MANGNDYFEEIVNPKELCVVGGPRGTCRNVAGFEIYHIFTRGEVKICTFHLRLIHAEILDVIERITKRKQVLEGM